MPTSGTEKPACKEEEEEPQEEEDSPQQTGEPCLPLSVLPCPTETPSLSLHALHSQRHQKNPTRFPPSPPNATDMDDAQPDTPSARPSKVGRRTGKNKQKKGKYTLCTPQPSPMLLLCFPSSSIPSRFYPCNDNLLSLSPTSLTLRGRDTPSRATSWTDHA